MTLDGFVFLTNCSKICNIQKLHLASRNANVSKFFPIIRLDITVSKNKAHIALAAILGQRCNFAVPTSLI